MLLTRIKLSSLIVAVAINLLVVGILNVREAHACSCASQTLEKEIRTSDAVFSGEVVGVESDVLLPGPGPPLGKVTFDVRDSWKGVSGQSVVVYGQGPEVSCGIDFEQGKSYLVYAYRSKGNEGDPLETSLCDATKPLAEAKGDLPVLGPPGATLPDTGGSVSSPIGEATTVAAAFVLLVLASTLVVWCLRRGEGT